jgi:hypothetical protein
MQQGDSAEVFVSNWTLATGTRPGERHIVDPEQGTREAPKDLNEIRVRDARGGRQED